MSAEDAGFMLLETLGKDHVVVLQNLHRLSEAAAQLGGGGPAVEEAERTIVDVANFLQEELEVHLQKEEEALFPPMEAVVGPMGPTNVMRLEHQDLRGKNERLQVLAADLVQVDAGEAESRFGELKGLISYICGLLESHIQKEDTILFPMAGQMLVPMGMAEVGRRLEKFEQSR